MALTMTLPANNKNRVRMNPMADKEFDLEEYEFGIPCFEVQEPIEYRLTIGKRTTADKDKTYYVVSVKASANDIFPKAVPYSYVEEIEDEFDGPAPKAELLLADSGAYLYENYEDASEVYRRTAYRMTRELQMSKVRRSKSKIRMIECRTCRTEKEWPFDPEVGRRVPYVVGASMTGVTVRPYMETDSGVCSEHYNA